DLDAAPIRPARLEDPSDAREAPDAGVDELARGRRQLLPRRFGVDLEPPGRLHQLALIPAAGRVCPRLDGAPGETQGAVRHHPGLVVLEHVAEALALRAR